MSIDFTVFLIHLRWVIIKQKTMLRKIGYSLSSIGVIGTALSIFYRNEMIKGVFITTTLISVFLFFVGLSFIFLNSNPQTRKKAKTTLLIIAVSLIVISIVSIYQHWVGARVELILGIFIYCFSYSPIALKDKYLKWRPFSKTKTEVFFLSFGDFISYNFIALGVLFKVQHWPYANVLMIYGSLLLVIFLLIWNSRFKKEIIKRKEREDMLEEKNKEILDSIQYAKRLQDAILPPLKLVKEYFEESFILFRPKDIVSGDFYWMETAYIKDPDVDVENAYNKKKLIFFAVADCTGHGVPGAMVSVVCANALNKCINELNLVDPGKILDKTRELVIETFSKQGTDVKDGMDISLCALNEFTGVLHWAGANNPLWIVRANQNSIEEIAPNKQPVGAYDHAQPFTTQELKIKEGDSIYMFSDGYADQFGTETGKKFKAKKFKDLLLEYKDEPMNRQKEILENAFDEWKGNLEQIDDVCVIGVKRDVNHSNPFTEREMELIQLLSQGLSSKIIADKLEISKDTVDTHRRKMLKKANAYNTTELLNFCSNMGII